LREASKVMYESASIRKKQKKPVSGLDAQRKLYARQIAANVSGSLRTQNEDPVFRLIDGFSEEFDAVGRARSAEHSDGQAGENEKTPEFRESTGEAELRKRHDSPVYSHSASELQTGDFKDRFSSHAFRHGRLAASVMAGKGKEMLVTCFKRAGTDSRPETGWQRSLEAGKAVSVPLMNQSADVTFVRDVNSAVGITLDAIRSAGRTLDIFRQLAGDDEAHSQNRLEKHGVETMRELYPFLKLDGDNELIARYKNEQKQLEGDRSPEGRMRAQALESALRKATAVKARKEFQKQRFLTVLTRIQNHVKEAEKLFSSDGFQAEMIEELTKAPDVPPEDNNRRRTLENTTLGEILEELFGDVGQETEYGEQQTESSGADAASDEVGKQ